MATITHTVDGRSETWRDPKRYLWPLSLIVPLLPLLAWVAVDATGWDAFWYAGPLWILVGVPVLDTLVGTDRGNPPEWAYGALDDDRYYRILTYLYLPLQYLTFFWGLWMVVDGGLSLFAQIGLTLTIGAVGGIGIANAHELGHKKDKLERWLAKVVLAQTGYGHFEIEHNRGHHTRVATPEDPATARFGETFWRFFPRSVVGGVRSGWRLEKQRLTRKGSSPWNLRNDVLNAWVMSVVLFAVTIAVLGPAVIPWLILQAVFGFSLLEVVNYLEHYGLLRQQDETGRYERTRPAHSWNSDHIVTNVVLYGLERHSDHHANPTRRYQTLR
ncbi:MAG: alkane 1-monooxygenase, partial [Acidimicrobiales bacterium]|nr:alkane 1-monooxygenase [Acidimicrobiales bacterium]